MNRLLNRLGVSRVGRGMDRDSREVDLLCDEDLVEGEDVETSFGQQLEGMLVMAAVAEDSSAVNMVEDFEAKYNDVVDDFVLCYERRLQELEARLQELEDARPAAKRSLIGALSSPPRAGSRVEGEQNGSVNE